MAGVLEQIQQQIGEMTAAISKLSDQVKSLERTGNLIRNPNELDTKCGQCKENPARDSGYVNWDETHDSLKNMQWMKCDAVRDNIFGTGDGGTIVMINEDTRFPLDDLYVCVSDPAVLYEIKYHKLRYTGDKYKIQPLLVNHLHTRHSFEEKYILRWVKNSDDKEVKNDYERTTDFK